MWIQRELYVTSPLNLQTSDNIQRGGTEHLILFIAECLGRRDNDRITGVHAHRVEILHVANGNAGIVGVAHYLIFDLFPADEGAFDHNLMAHGEGEPTLADFH